MCKDLAQRTEQERERERERERAYIRGCIKTAPSKKLTIFMSLTTKMLRGQTVASIGLSQHYACGAQSGYEYHYRGAS